MKTLNVSQIQRQLNLLNDFDIIEVVDKKKNTVKGYFVDVKYSKTIKDLEAKKNKKSILSYAGIWKDRDMDLESLRQEAWRN